MNTLLRFPAFRPEPRTIVPDFQAPARRMHRTRDFGVGYGSSSGYASNKRYTPSWGQPRFRFG